MPRKTIIMNETDNLVFVRNRLGRARHFKARKVNGEWYIAEKISITTLKTTARWLGLSTINGKSREDLFLYVFGASIKPIEDLVGG